MVKKTEIKVPRFISFNIISYFICLIQNSLILDQLWSMLVHMALMVF